MATRIKPARGGTPYETDVVAWAEAQAEALRAGRFDELDLENLAEEIADGGQARGGSGRLGPETSSCTFLTLTWRMTQTTGAQAERSTSGHDQPFQVRPSQVRSRNV